MQSIYLGTFQIPLLGHEQISTFSCALYLCLLIRYITVPHFPSSVCWSLCLCLSLPLLGCPSVRMMIIKSIQAPSGAMRLFTH
ncbi:hypothetical protein BGX38DRAFT_1195151 [Terfezia claveryi]|nr:hypothetical protein BGX38DRAFT_1240500 [Terfezia claveryi]KAF8445524.1 hypothetical protein BGX38DRAFT_1195151 [Terfezia claveryi]